jgi:hypothetical protein
MATVATTVDRRRTDFRSYTHEVPFWLTSALIDYNKDTGKTVCLFDFPKGTWFIHTAGVEVVTACAGGTPSIDVGFMTAAVQAFVDGATFTYTATDGLIDTTDVTEATAAFYPSAVAAYAGGAGSVLVGATTTMPIIAATLAASGTAGQFRVHVLLSRLPVVST